MSVSDITGLPIFEVFSNDRIVMGRYGANALVVSGSDTIISGSLTVDGPTIVKFNRITSSYTLALVDAGKMLEVSSSAAATLTIPPDSSVNFMIGTNIDVVQYATSSVSIVTGSGVTLRSSNNWNKINGRYGAASLVKSAANDRYLFGNLSA